MRILCGVILLITLYSCTHENLKYDKPYFDFDSLVQVQVRQIALAKAGLMKQTFLKGKSDSATFTPDTTQWKHELDAFQQLDAINKPLYKGTYQLSDQEDDHSNLRLHAYTTSGKIKSPVPEVRFYYQDGRKLKRIESQFNEENVLYSTSRKLTLEFEEHHGTLVISSYYVSGFQKMILNDTVKFSIKGKLSFP